MQAAEGSRLRGASRIIGVDINPEKFTKGIFYLLQKKKGKRKDTYALYDMHIQFPIN
jgi:hypothetical protein